jgi:hypothetical protein
MTIDLTKCRLSPSGYVITCKGVLSFAQGLYNPKPNKQGKIKYGLNLLVPPTHDLTLLKNEMGKIALANLKGDQNRAKQFVEKRFLNPNNLPNGGKPMGERFEGWTLVRAYSDYKPGITHPSGDPIPEDQIQNELYSGRWGSALLNAYWSGNSENPGVFIGLQGIQLLDHDENIGVVIPKAENEFSAVGDAKSEAVGNQPAVDATDVDSMFG